ncbi:MAG: hypothetical protein V4559_10520 [Pseudomonadota bacterium]
MGREIIDIREVDCFILCTSAFIIFAGATTCARASEASDVALLKSQPWTGTLLGVSPGAPRAGLFVVEPYILVKHGTGSFDGRGDWHPGAADEDQLKMFSLVMYSFTDRLSFQMFPTIGRKLGSHGSDIGAGDLPIRIKYRILDGGSEIWKPSTSLGFGITLPVGKYNHLKNSSDGIGGGAFSLTEQIVLQSIFLSGPFPNRMRVWASVSEPLHSVGLQGISSYGTDQGFIGSVFPSITAQVGWADEFAISKVWVLSLDVVQDFGKSAHLHDNRTSRLSRTSWGSNFSIAPAIEYNLTEMTGLLVGVQIPISGHNAASTVVPQIALNLIF